MKFLKDVLTGLRIGNDFAPRASAAYPSEGRLISTMADLEEAIRGGVSEAGVHVTPETAMRVSAVFACVRIISGSVANMPLNIMRRVDDKVRVMASDHALWKILRRRPNKWQTPSQFKRMMQAHLLLRGNAYAMIVRSRGQVIDLIPLNPDRVKVKQNDDWSLTFTYTRRDGGQVDLAQSEVLHLVGLTLDGITGVSPIAYARETVGLSLAMEEHGARTFRNQARPSMVLKSQKRLGEEGRSNLQASLQEFRSGGSNEGKALILEDGLDHDKLTMTAADVQWIESRKFSRTDIFMVYGLPPFMAGDTEKSTSWGTGIEQQKIGYTTFSLEDHTTTWEEATNRDLITDAEPDLYAKFNRSALLRGDLAARKDFYTSMLQWGVYNPDEVRAKEDENPRPDGKGNIYYDPPNAPGGEAKPKEEPKP